MHVVRVLKLVDQEVMVAGLETKSALRELASLLQEIDGAHEDIGEVEPGSHPFELLETFRAEAIELEHSRNRVEVFLTYPLPIGPSHHRGETEDPVAVAFVGTRSREAALRRVGANLLSWLVVSGQEVGSDFLDVGGTFADDIDAIAYAQITQGCQPSLYCPGDSLTRAQMAVFLVRAFDLPPAPSAGFTDAVGHQFEAEIDRLAAAGITLGCGGTSYCPNGVVTRGQMAAFLSRALGL